jgi:cytoskeletal protein RodZ
MRQRLDITDVEAQTKIRAKYLRALENEDFGMLPGSTFVKSFLRTYAEFLGLDPHVLVEEYRIRHDPRDESELTPFAGVPHGRQRQRPPRRPGWLPAAAAIFAILVLLLVLGLTGNNSPGGGGSTPVSTPTSAKKTKKPATQAPKQAAQPRTVHLRIVPASATYVCVDKGLGTKVVYEGTLVGSKSWTARHLRVNLGRRAVRVTVNGKRVSVPAGTDPVGFDFRPHSRRMLPLGQRPCA